MVMTLGLREVSKWGWGVVVVRMGAGRGVVVVVVELVMMALLRWLLLRLLWLVGGRIVVNKHTGLVYNNRCSCDGLRRVGGPYF